MNRASGLELKTGLLSRQEKLYCLPFFGAREATRLRQGYGVVVRATRYFGASELTIFSKRGSPRNGSHIGLERK